MWWSWVLTAVGVTGFILAGRKVWWAWYVNIACQFLWLGYALSTGQYGFLAGVAVYTVVFTQNAIKWTRDRSVTEQRGRCDIPECTDPRCQPGWRSNGPYANGGHRWVHPSTRVSDRPIPQPPS